MRKGIHSLYHLVKQESELSALSGDYFVFMGSNRKSIKILWWQTNGFCLYHKKLELGSYSVHKQIDKGVFVESDMRLLGELLSQIVYRSVGNELRTQAMLSV